MNCRRLKFFRVVSLLAAVSTAVFSACGGEDDPPVNEGEFVVLTYNVAGLPAGLSSSDPERNIPLISPLLNGYDLVLVQEDFWYFNELRAEVSHRYVTDPMYEERDILQMGDGLNRFSNIRFEDHERLTWVTCYGTTTNGSDCLTEKGYSVAPIRLASGIRVDVYNLHMDAGSDPEDVAARDDQLDQLLADMAVRSAGRAVILAGDTNMDADDPEELVQLERLLNESGLTDACTTLLCGEDHKDRVLYRSSDTVTLEPRQWSTPPEFVDGDGLDLSDHKPVAVRFAWTRVQPE